MVHDRGEAVADSQLWQRGCPQQEGPSEHETEHPRADLTTSGPEAVFSSFALKGKKNTWNIYSESLENKKHRTPQLVVEQYEGKKGLQSTYIHKYAFTQAPIYCSIGRIFKRINRREI